MGYIEHELNERKLYRKSITAGRENLTICYNTDRLLQRYLLTAEIYCRTSVDLCVFVDVYVLDDLILVSEKARVRAVDLCRCEFSFPS